MGTLTQNDWGQNRGLGVVWEWLGVEKGKMGDLSLQKGDLPKLLCIIFFYEISGSGKPMALKRC